MQKLLTGAYNCWKMVMETQNVNTEGKQNPEIKQEVKKKPDRRWVKCYNCKILGHLSSDCPERRFWKEKQSQYIVHMKTQCDIQVELKLDGLALENKAAVSENFPVPALLITDVLLIPTSILNQGGESSCGGKSTSQDRG